MVIISFDPGNTGNPSILIQFWSWKYWKTTHIDSVLILEILENQSCWFSFDPGNTGKPVMLIQFWSWKHWNTSHSNNLGVWTYTFGCLNLYFGCLNLYFECLNLYFGCLNLYFGCLNLYFGCLNFQMTAAATAATSQKLSASGKTLEYHVQEPNIPFGGIPYFDNINI